MWLLSILSAALFALPVFVTFGAYFGADHQRILECGFHCGNPDDNPYGSIPSSGGGNANITGSIFCQKETAITPDPGRYVCTFTPALAAVFIAVGADDLRFSQSQPMG